MGALQCYRQVADKIQQSFSENSQVVNILGFSIFIVTILLCLFVVEKKKKPTFCSVKTDTDKTQSEQVWLCSNEAIYKKKKKCHRQ